ncbi:branched-chain amino acid ABC transporter substrate-binding protein [Rhizobium sp. AG855]|uniref:branched-chain amino acid ABC transporter substrate-binding protein n=1 Tax=Rhizobium sp. AG855 TaxID=2183898 RepID=UPI000E728713|nr:branched-chain amino acid ABC transporter substrate-binding protein [Rhizobium sp. AG855]RKE84531.1 amino acid/amide ABC transporter substrate-binding protein (HAAT family) [Rhizobium sp. AG855]
MKRLLLTGAMTAIAFAPAFAEPLTLAVVAPKSGLFDVLGEQVRQGAHLAADRLSISLVEIEESCTEGSGPKIAEQIRAAGAKAAIGFLCSESLVGGLPQLAEAGIPAITLSVRWKGLMEDSAKESWPFFRLAPDSDAEAKKLSEIILRDWAGDAVALLDDGTIRGRELADAVRASLEESGLKPVFTDTFRPGQEQQLTLVRRLKKTGASRVFIGGDRNDVAVIARDAKADKLALTILGGDAMRAANEPVPLEDGVLAVGLDETPRGPNAEALAAELTEKKISAEGYVLPAHAAVTILADAAGISSAVGTALPDALVGTPFETALGPVTFGEDHELSENPYRLLEWKGNAFVAVPDKTQ